MKPRVALNDHQTMSCMKMESHTVGTEVEGLYHEKQVKELCALHALNNLFQQKQAFTKKDLDAICLRLSPNKFLNPHRSILGLGNYDVNVIMAALQDKQCDTIWFDKRKDLKSLVLENIKGFILNIPSEMRFGVVRLPIPRKHWICIRCMNGQYYNFDSKLDSPEIIGKPADVISYLQKELQSKEKELLLVVDKAVSDASSWQQDTTK